MMVQLTRNTKALLMLTAPLLASRRSSRKTARILKPAKPLSMTDYKPLAAWLRDEGACAADLMARDGDERIARYARYVADVSPGRSTEDGTEERLSGLLDRGVQLALAVERWNQRAIWVVGRGDRQYPERWEERLGDEAPPVLYGCGDPEFLSRGGLAVVGSRHAPDEALHYAEQVGQLAAHADCTIVSGGARGVDQAAMRGALEGGGIAVGVLAHELERAALHRDHRQALADGQLTLASHVDPGVRFLVGHAMARNKLIYGLADAALVAAYERGKGGTWKGATEQLDKHRFTTVYVRRNGALVEKGAKPWPNPRDSTAFRQALVGLQAEAADATSEVPTTVASAEETAQGNPAEEVSSTDRELFGRSDSEAETLDVLVELDSRMESLDKQLAQTIDQWNDIVDEKVLEVLGQEKGAKSAAEITELLKLPAIRRKKVQARLNGLSKSRQLEKSGKGPVRYHLAEPSPRPPARTDRPDGARSGQYDRPEVDDTNNTAFRRSSHAAPSKTASMSASQPEHSTGEASQRTLSFQQT